MVSDHFDGRRFHNPGQAGERSLWQVLRWALTRQKQPWPKWIDDPPQPAPQPRLAAEQVALTFVNHATFLLQLGGVNILTDPHWSERASPVQWAGPRRVRRPGIAWEQLPPIDVVLVSHNHYDHLDLPTPAPFAAARRAAVRERPRQSSLSEQTWTAEGGRTRLVADVSVQRCRAFHDDAGAALFAADAVRSKPDTVGRLLDRIRDEEDLLCRRQCVWQAISCRSASASVRRT